MITKLSYKWRSLWKPELFHGFQKKKSFFEGWYFKLVTHDESSAFAIIPGISMDNRGNKQAFIQILNGTDSSSAYHEFDFDSFSSNKKDFHVEIAGNIFSKTEIHLNLPDFNGKLQLQNISPWPKYLLAPGIMGWYSFVPFMECYHGIISMNHNLHGKFNYKNQEINFDGGRGYIEKDWGVSFPKTWIWMQSNHFKEDFPISVTASTAYIPWLGSYFIGFIAGIWYKDILIRFASYTGARMKANVLENEVNISFKSKKYLLEIKSVKAPGGQLISPILGEMKGKLNESLQAQMHIKLFEYKKLIYEGHSHTGGLEIAGDYDILLTDKWRN
jgi:uncharacterized protein Usg